MIRSILTAGYHVLFTDLDIAWLQVLPLPFLLLYFGMEEVVSVVLSLNTCLTLWLNDDQLFITL